MTRQRDEQERQEQAVLAVQRHERNTTSLTIDFPDTGVRSEALIAIYKELDSDTVRRLETHRAAIQFGVPAHVYLMRELLSTPGKDSLWGAFCIAMGWPRRTADRVAQHFAERMAQNGHLSPSLLNPPLNPTGKRRHATAEGHRILWEDLTYILRSEYFQDVFNGGLERWIQAPTTQNKDMLRTRCVDLAGLLLRVAGQAVVEGTISSPVLNPVSPSDGGGG